MQHINCIIFYSILTSILFLLTKFLNSNFLANTSSGSIKVSYLRKIFLNISQIESSSSSNSQIRKKTTKHSKKAKFYGTSNQTCFNRYQFYNSSILPFSKPTFEEKFADVPGLIQKFKKLKEQERHNTTTKPPQPHYRVANLICLGVKKCGTGALQRFLKLHSKINLMHQAANRSEGNFFNSKDYKKGPKYYSKLWNATFVNEINFEKTPRYFEEAHIPGRIANFYNNQINRKNLPRLLAGRDLTFIVITCNPTNRAWSDYINQFHGNIPDKGLFKPLPRYAFLNQTVKRKSSKTKYKIFKRKLPGNILINKLVKNYKNFTSISKHFIDELEMNGFDRLNSTEYVMNLRLKLKTYQQSIISSGLYYMQLSYWLSYFAKSRFFFINSQEMMENPGKVLIKLQKFLNLPIELTEDSFIKDKNSGFFCPKHKPSKNHQTQTTCTFGKFKGRSRSNDENSLKMPEEAKKILDDFYRDWNEKFYGLVGEDYGW